MNPQDFIPFVWPVFAMVCVAVFRAPLGRLVDRIRGFDLSVKDGRIKLTAAEANEAAQTLLNETSQMIAQLGPDELTIFGRIVRAIEGGQVTLDSLFPPGFQRRSAKGGDSPELISLRKLRDAQLIRPKGRGQFKDNKELEIKEFGKILLRTHRDKLVPPAA